MKKILILALGAVGLLTALPASAETFDFFAVPVGTGSSGRWRVTATRALTTDPFAVTVKADTVSPPNQDAVQIALTFFTGLCDTPTIINGTGNSGQTSGGGASDPAANGLWGGNGAPNASITFNALSPVRALKNSTNGFTGNAVLVSNSAILQMKADITGDGSVSWQGCTEFNSVVTPEPASMALALAGLAPIAAAIRRRRRK